MFMHAAVAVSFYTTGHFTAASPFYGRFFSPQQSLEHMEHISTCQMHFLPPNQHQQTTYYILTANIRHT